MEKYDYSKFIEDFETDLAEYSPRAGVAHMPYKGVGMRFNLVLESGERVEVVARLLDKEGD